MHEVGIHAPRSPGSDRDRDAMFLETTCKGKGSFQTNYENDYFKQGTKRISILYKNEKGIQFCPANNFTCGLAGRSVPPGRTGAPTSGTAQ